MQQLTDLNSPMPDTSNAVKHRQHIRLNCDGSSNGRQAFRHGEAHDGHASHGATHQPLATTRRSNSGPRDLPRPAFDQVCNPSFCKCGIDDAPDLRSISRALVGREHKEQLSKFRPFALR